MSFMTPRLKKLQQDVEQAKSTLVFLKQMRTDYGGILNTVNQWKARRTVDASVLSGQEYAIMHDLRETDSEMKYWQTELDTRQATYMDEEMRASGQRSFTSSGQAEKYARGAGRLAGKGLTALGKRLSALETEPRDYRVVLNFKKGGYTSIGPLRMTREEAERWVEREYTGQLSSYVIREE